MAAGSAVSLSGASALSALDAARELREGRLSAEAYARALLARIDALEPDVQAWAWLDREQALAQARAFDGSLRRSEREVGEAEARLQAGGFPNTEPGALPDAPLGGMPVGVKDIIDVRGMPTEDGTVLHAGRIATDDAALIARLRAAGAWPIGKTVTTEMATYTPGKTRNPHHLAHSPGGSSSGSAAAVACGMVPLAIGTQTNGSMIRPASYCGVVGFKPSFGRIGRSGVLEQSPVFDQIGVFARTVEDVAALAHALTGPDPHDAFTRTEPLPPWTRASVDEPAVAPRLAWTRTPWWDRVDPDARQAFEAWATALGDRIVCVDLPPETAEVVAFHRTVMEADIAGSYEREYERGREQLSASLQRQIERGRTVTAVEYRKALAYRRVFLASLAPCFDRFEALVTPAALGTAPLLAQGTGDPLMCTAWSYTGLPALSLPLLQGADGLPLGVQLVGAPGNDEGLLRTARWLMRQG